MRDIAKRLHGGEIDTSISCSAVNNTPCGMKGGKGNYPCHQARVVRKPISFTGKNNLSKQFRSQSKF